MLDKLNLWQYNTELLDTYDKEGESKGMNINDIVPKLSGLHCGSRPTSCPDQLTKGIEAYLKAKSEIKV